VGLADDLLVDARDLAAKGTSENRSSCLRRSISTAYYAVFHMLVEDFISQWPLVDQRPRLAGCSTTRDARSQGQRGRSEEPNPSRRIFGQGKTAFQQLQADRHGADYDLSWNISPSDATNAVTLAVSAFAEWQSVRQEQLARHYLLSMFVGPNR
jgi:hypothetical protein